MNIRFIYLYRDAGNFKNWGDVIFSNPRDIDTCYVEKLVEKSLIDQLYFFATKASVEDLHFKDHKKHLDHDWHEVHSFEPTNDAPTDPYGRNIEEFIESLRGASTI